MVIALLLAAALFAAPCMAQYVDAPTPDNFVSEYGTEAYAYQPSLSNNTATTVKSCEWTCVQHMIWSPRAWRNSQVRVAPTALSGRWGSPVLPGAYLGA